MSLESLRKQFEEEKLRDKVLELWRKGGMSLQQIADHEEVKRSKSTVQYIIKRFKDRRTTQTLAKVGRPCKSTRRCVNIAFLAHFQWFSWLFRYRNSLRRLAGANPFWGASRLADYLHRNMVDALSRRPPGAVYQV